MNILYIDTSDSEKIIVKLQKNDEIFLEESLRDPSKAQAALPLIEKIINKAGISTNEIDKIMVKKGPGSFTGLRVGISIANALSFALGVKVNDKEIGEIEEPHY